MNVLDFLKSAGKSLVGGGASAPQADVLKKELDSYGLGSKDLKVSVDGDKVTLDGKVSTQEALEKAMLAIGNAVGVARVAAGAVKVEDIETGAGPVGSEGKASNFYTVQKGDTLWKIAEEQYGKGQGAKNNLIFEANKPMLTSPDKIYPGQVLRIPPLK